MRVAVSYRLAGMMPTTVLDIWLDASARLRQFVAAVDKQSPESAFAQARESNPSSSDGPGKMSSAEAGTEAVPKGVQPERMSGAGYGAQSPDVDGSESSTHSSWIQPSLPTSPSSNL